MPIVDLNCTLGRRLDGGPCYEDAASLLAGLDALGIERALVRHALGRSYDPQEANRLLAAETAGRPRLTPCWAGVTPTAGELGDAAAWVEGLCPRVVCLYPAAHGYPLAAWQCDALLSPLAATSGLLLLEAAETGWEALHGVCTAYPALRVALLEPGYRALRPLTGLLAAHANLYLDISTLVTFRGLEALAERFGKRLLFGSGVPRHEGAGPLAMLAYSDLSVSQRAAVAGGTLTRLLAEAGA